MNGKATRLDERPRRSLRLWITTLPVVALMMDVAVFAIQHIVQAFTLMPRKMAVRLGMSFVAINLILLAFEPRGFARRKLTFSDPVGDAPLLIALAPIDKRRVRERHQTGSKHNN